MSIPVRLRHEAYRIVIHFNQISPQFRHLIDIKRTETSFQVKFSGPDTEECPMMLPFSCLFEKAGSRSKVRPWVITWRISISNYSMSAHSKNLSAHSQGSALCTSLCLHADKKHCDELGFMLDYDRFMVPRTINPQRGQHSSRTIHQLSPSFGRLFPAKLLRGLSGKAKLKASSNAFRWLGTHF
jgi:hypothetical protein